MLRRRDASGRGAARALMGRLGAIALITLFGLATAGAEQGGEGAALFDANCAACHSGDLIGAPTLDLLRRYSPEIILQTLVSGVMSDESAHLSLSEKRAIATFTAGSDFLEVRLSESAYCAEGHPVTLGDDPAWPGWDAGADNRAFQPAERAGLTGAEVPRLSLKWAFGVPNGTRMRGQPAVIGSLLLLPTQRGTIYALDRETGCIVWERNIGGDFNSAVALGRPDPQGPWLAFLGNNRAGLYAIDVATGEEIWSLRPFLHDMARLSGSPRYHDGRVFIGISSYEVAAAARASYPCCDFRGSLIAVDAETGELLWRSFMIDEPAAPTYENADGVMQQGPSGAPIWSTPAVSPELGLVYVGTGQNYSSPATDRSSAIVAMEIETGAVRWSFQGTEGDVYNLSCYGDRKNCPPEDGPDFDFGASPVLIDTPSGPWVLAGQKSGVVFALDAAGGEKIWEQRVGRGGTLGGIHFGLAVEGGRLFVPVSDRFEMRLYPEAAQPGIAALEIATGKVLWQRSDPKTCGPEDYWCQVFQGYSAAPTAMPGAVFIGSIDGKLYAYDTEDGDLLWLYDTVRQYATVNGVPGSGGSLDAAGPVIAGGMVYVNSGYTNESQIPGNVLLAFSVDGK